MAERKQLNRRETVDRRLVENKLFVIHSSSLWAISRWEVCIFFFFKRTGPPPISPLFPHTPLSRSALGGAPRVALPFDWGPRAGEQTRRAHGYRPPPVACGNMWGVRPHSTAQGYSRSAAVRSSTV